MYGVDSFDAIVNAPQAAILAVGRIADRIVPVDGAAAVRPVLQLTPHVRSPGRRRRPGRRVPRHARVAARGARRARRLGRRRFQISSSPSATVSSALSTRSSAWTWSANATSALALLVGVCRIEDVALRAARCRQRSRRCRRASAGPPRSRPGSRRFHASMKTTSNGPSSVLHGLEGVTDDELDAVANRTRVEVPSRDRRVLSRPPRA